jgi:hypothetical protein
MQDPSSGNPSSDAKFEKAIDVSVAEFNALRSEVASATNIQVSIISVAITAIGVIIGYSFNKDGNPQLLIAVPLISAAAIIIYVGAALRIASISTYIHTKLWPYLSAKISDENLPSWERHLTQYRLSSRAAFPIDGSIGISVGALLFGSGLVAAFYTPNIPFGVALLAALFLIVSTVISVGVYLLKQRGRYY